MPGFLPRKGSYFSTDGAGGGTSPVVFPAPNSGINAVDPVATLSPQFSQAADNLIADGRGLRVRSGYAQFATGVGSSDIRTILPFQGSTSASDRLFCAGTAGIYNISAGGAGPWVVDIAFVTPSGNAGFGVWTNYVLDSGSHYAFYADEVNGLYQYPQGGAWTRTAAAITGPAGNANSFAFVAQHKGRLWFAERDSARAWYLPAGAVAGATTRFDFGNKFNHGGNLIGIFTWTVDGGDGVDDYLVALSSGGDAIVYRGQDPSSPATWEVVGQYYLGALPAGRRQAASFGGELYILSQYGLVPMSRVVTGRPVQEQDIYASRNISPLITADLAASRTSFGWEVKPVPTENVLLVPLPKDASQPYRQYALSSRTNGWCTFSALSYTSGDMFQGTFYMGGPSGAVNRLTGNQDNVPLAGTAGDAISWSLLTSFQDMGQGGIFHRAQFIRPLFRADSPPSYAVQARYDYDDSVFTPLTPLPSPFGSGATPIWDSTLWGGTTTNKAPSGASGLGFAVGVALVGASAVETRLLRIDVMTDSGGFL